MVSFSPVYIPGLFPDKAHAKLLPFLLSYLLFSFPPHFPLFKLFLITLVPRRITEDYVGDETKGFSPGSVYLGYHEQFLYVVQECASKSEC